LIRFKVPKVPQGRSKNNQLAVLVDVRIGKLQMHVTLWCMMKSLVLF